MAEAKSDYQLHIISHTHWDREWYLSFETFRLQLVDLFDHLIELMESDSEFRYFHTDGQTIIIDDYLELRPHMRERLTALIRAGRILIGPWYLQNDEFLTLGESTVRNMLLGYRMCRELDAQPMGVGYIPDQFGNISQMPQILRGFGIDSCVFGRGFTGPGVPEFLWKAPDGSEVFAVHLFQWYNNAQRLPVDHSKSLAMIQEILNGYRKANAQSRQVLLMNGVDHLQPQENLSEIIRDLNAAQTEYQFVHSTLPAFIAAVRAEVQRPRTYQGEFRDGEEPIILSGTASCRVYLKQSNFECQQELVRWVEPLAVLAMQMGSKYDFRRALDYAWKLLIQNHPHDSICGCSIDEVHLQMEARFHRVADILRDQLRRAMWQVAASIHVGDREHHSILTVFNPLPVKRAEVFEARIELLLDEPISSFALRDSDGSNVDFHVIGQREIIRRVLNPKRLPKSLQVREHRVLVDSHTLPASGYETMLLVRKDGPAASSLLARKEPARKKRNRKYRGQQIVDAGIVLQNERLTAKFNANGSFNLTDSASGTTFRGLHVFEDVGDSGSEYIFRKAKNDSERTTEYLDAELEVMENVPLRQSVKVCWKWKLPPEVDERTDGRPGRMIDYPIVSVFSLRKGAAVIEIETQLRNTAKDHRLRVLFPTSLKARTSFADCAYDVVERPFDMGIPNRNNTHPMESFFAVAGAKNGLAVFSAGMPEFEVLKQESTMCLTLLRCVDILGNVPPNWVREQLVDDHAPGAQCLRSFRFRYAVHPFAGAFEAARIKLECDRYLHPPRVFQLPADRGTWAGERPGESEFWKYFEDESSALPEPQKSAPIHASLLSVDKHLTLTALKPGPELSDIAAVVRVVNLGKKPRDPDIQSDRGTIGVQRANLREEPEEGATTVTPGQIATFLCDFRK